MRKDWYERILFEFATWDGRPWIWGETDCAHFVEACLRAMLGDQVDFLGTFRGNYSSRLTAAARLIGHGYGSTLEFARARLEGLGAKAIDPRAAPVGAIGVADDGTLCVRFPVGFVARDEKGRFHKTPAIYAWSFD